VTASSVARLRRAVTAAALTLWAAAGCDPTPTALIDSFPIPLKRAPIGNGLAGDGALVALGGLPDGSRFDMVVDSASVATALSGGPGVTTARAGFDLYDALDARDPPPLRASFRNHELVRMPIAPIGDGTSTAMGILGGTLLRGYSIELRFGAACATGRCSSMTFWRHVGADAGFLADAGFAVYRFSLYGGGEYTANGNADFLGLRGPLVLPPTRVLMRTCAVPRPFTPSPVGVAVPACCTAADAAAQSTGTELALLLATGVGPLVLSQSAWNRVVRGAMALPAPDTVTLTLGERTPSLHIATWPTPIAASWSSLPRLAFVDPEIGGGADPGACVELARARRTEQVSFLTVQDPASRVCFQPCDADARERGKAQSSAAYLEVGGAIPVAVVDDDAAFLQAMRFDVRPEGPELDGLVGAAVFGRARVELDYLSTQRRALMSCEEGVPRAECWAAARCPRLPDRNSFHYCFGYGKHTLPAGCDAVDCSAP
jgi:hypothetical protein